MLKENKENKESEESMRIQLNWQDCDDLDENR